MMISYAYSPEWRVQLLELLDEAFGVQDHADYIRQVDFWGSEARESMRLRVDERDHTLVAYMLTAEYGMADSESQYAYLYCVCTRESRRGTGIMGAFLRDELARLRQEGYQGVALIPSTEQLVRYYAAFGFQSMSTVIYGQEPASRSAATIQPSGATAAYLAQLPPSEPDYPVEVDPESRTLLRPPAGWMLLPLQPFDFEKLALAQPLT